ncbi:hypothetical protein TNCV_1643871 [Trichonephila clavipes]|nr:hypothetical protein TNCV_1643871 [Trichonephila clavipes]
MEILFWLNESAEIMSIVTNFTFDADIRLPCHCLLTPIDTYSSCGHNCLVVMISDSWPVRHEFEPLCRVKAVEAQSSPIGVEQKFEEGSSSSLDHGSKLRGP